MFKMLLDNELAMFITFIIVVVLLGIGVFVIDRTTRTPADICEGTMYILQKADRTPEVFLECLKVQGGISK